MVNIEVLMENVKIQLVTIYGSPTEIVSPEVLHIRVQIVVFLWGLEWENTP